MGVSGKEFEGKLFYRPGARGKFKARDQIPGTSIDLFTQVIIGRSDNGPDVNDTNLPEEERYITVASFEEAQRIFKKGELLSAAYLATRPSNEEQFATGPQLLKLLNINPNTKANQTFNSVQAGVNHTVKAAIAGPDGNKIRIRKNLTDQTIEIGDSVGIETSPKLDKLIFDIIYIGNATSRVLEVSATDLKITISGQSDSTTSLSISFLEFETIGDVINKVNAQTGYIATLYDSPDFLCKNLDHTLLSEAIDPTTVRQIKANLYLEELFINGSELALVTPNSVRKPFANQIAFAYLAGGSKGIPSGTAMRDAITFSKKVSGMYRNILTSNLSDQVHLKSIVNEMISPLLGSETMGGCGSDISMTVSQRKSNQKTLGSYGITYGFSPFNAFDYDGKEKVFNGYMLAVIDNAISAASSPIYTPTWKPLNILRTSELLDPSERDKVIADGGLVLSKKPNNGAWIIERSVTTELKENLILNEKSMVATALTMVREMRIGFNDLFIGRTLVDSSSLVAGVTETDLKNYVRDTLVTFVEKGYLIGSELLGKLPFEEDFRIIIDGDTWYLNLKGNITSPINFIFYILELDTLKGAV